MYVSAICLLCLLKSMAKASFSKPLIVLLFVSFISQWAQTTFFFLKGIAKFHVFASVCLSFSFHFRTFPCGFSQLLDMGRKVTPIKWLLLQYWASWLLFYGFLFVCFLGFPFLSRSINRDSLNFQISNSMYFPVTIISTCKPENVFMIWIPFL